MTKAEFVRVVAKAAGESQVVVTGVLDAICKQIMVTVKAEGKFSIVDFGGFIKHFRAEREAGNFGRGKTLVPAHNTVRFKPSGFFKDYVNKK